MDYKLKRDIQYGEMLGFPYYFAADKETFQVIEKICKAGEIGKFETVGKYKQPAEKRYNFGNKMFVNENDVLNNPELFEPCS